MRPGRIWGEWATAHVPVMRWQKISQRCIVHTLKLFMFYNINCLSVPLTSLVKYITVTSALDKWLGFGCSGEIRVVAEFHTWVLIVKNRDYICGWRHNLLTGKFYWKWKTGSRSEIRIQLPPSEFIRMLEKAWDFYRACDGDEGRMSASYLDPNSPDISSWHLDYVGKKSKI